MQIEYNYNEISAQAEAAAVIVRKEIEDKMKASEACPIDSITSAEVPMD